MSEEDQDATLRASAHDHEADGAATTAADVAAGATTTAPVLALVYRGSHFVEITDAAVTLHDLCVAFGIADVTSVYVRDRRTRHVVATLPFEALPLQHVTAAHTDTDDDKDDDEDEEGYKDNDSGGDGMATLTAPTTRRRASHIGVYDIVTRGNNDAASVHDNNDNNNNGNTFEAGAAASATNNTADTTPHSGDAVVREAQTRALHSLVELGVVDLLTSELPQRLSRLREYVPCQAPGLLRRCVYAPSVYSPHRTHRDPLCHNTHNTSSSNDDDDSSACAYANTLPYRSAVDEYEAEMTHILQSSAHATRVASTLHMRPFAASELDDSDNDAVPTSATAPAASSFVS